MNPIRFLVNRRNLREGESFDWALFTFGRMSANISDCRSWYFRCYLRTAFFGWDVRYLHMNYRGFNAVAGWEIILLGADLPAQSLLHRTGYRNRVLWSKNQVWPQLLQAN